MLDHQNMNASLNMVKEASQNRDQEEDQYRDLVESVEDYAIFLLDPAGIVVTWNKGGQKIKQYKPAEIIGRPFTVFYTADAIAQKYPEKELQEALKVGRYEDEGWRVRKDGSIFWANVIITPIYKNGKRHIGFSKITRDLTTRKKAEDDLYKAYQELKESEERYRLLIEGVGDYAIFMLDVAGNVATWNEGAKRIKGYEPNEIIGRSFSRFYSQQDKERGFPNYELAEARREGRFEDLGWRIRKDGSAFWANVVITAIHNPEGKLIGFSKITRDLTDRKMLEERLFQANEELKETEERARLLVESVKDYAILMLNLSGEIISWNIGAERIKGYQAKEIIGRHFSVFYSREAIAKGFPQYELNRSLADGRFEDEGWRIRKDGSAFWANVIITPIYNSTGRHIGYSKITRDLTEVKRNVELMQKNQELMRINRDLDNFVYAASHDLKSPIVNLEGLIGELKYEMGAEQEKYAELLPWIDDALLNLKKIVGELAEVTRTDREDQMLEKICLEDLLREIKDSLRDNINSNQVQITADFSEVPAISYSRKNLRSILFNLVSNAIKYAHADRIPEIMIQTQFWPDDNLVELTVSDNGLGSPQNQKDKIFSMFRRLHTHVEGSGVGLYLVKRILENQGDWIEVESEVGEGSSFKVFIKQKQQPV
jgi:PAS domain S-box-containing protein